MNCIAFISRQTVLPVRFYDGQGFGLTVYDPDGSIHSWKMIPSNFMELYRLCRGALDKTLEGDVLTIANGIWLDIDDTEDVWLHLDQSNVQYRIKVTYKLLQGILSDMDNKTDCDSVPEEGGE